MSRPTAIAGTLLAMTLAVVTTGIEADDKPQGAISAGKIAKDPQQYYGKTVTVRAEVEDVIDDKTITLDEDAVLAGPDVLVLLPSGAPAGLSAGQKVTVTGQVRQYVVQELERDFDWFKRGKLVDVQKRVELETRTVIVAESIRITGMDTPR